MKKLNKQSKAFIKNLETTQIFEKKKKTISTNDLPILAVDYGEKQSGLAISYDGICALPFEIVPTEVLKTRLNALIKEKNTKQLVFGIPISGDGKEERLCKTIRNFATSFDSQVNVIFINERSSSQSTAPQKNSKRIDDLAAAQILEYFLA